MCVDIQKWMPCDKDHPSVMYKELTDLPSDKVSSSLNIIVLNMYLG